MTVLFLMDIRKKHVFPLLRDLFHAYGIFIFMAEIVYLVLFLFQLIYVVQEILAVSSFLSPLVSVQRNNVEEVKNIGSGPQLQGVLVVEPAADECLPPFTVFCELKQP